VLRRQCNWCGKQADAIGDDGARELGWLVGATAMCSDCAGPLVCGLCGAEECGCERHVIPANDVIEHESEPDCACAPQCEPVKRDDGSVGWLYIHHSLDGREHHEVNLT